MTHDEETCSLLVIEFCRKTNRKTASAQAEVGARLEDIALGAVYSAYDLAVDHVGDHESAIAWLRDAVGVLEAGCLKLETLQ